MPSSSRALLLLTVVLVTGCPAPRPASTLPTTAAAQLTDRLRYRPDARELIAHAPERLQRAIEDVFLQQDVTAVATLVDERHMRVVLPGGAAPIPWPALALVAGVTPPPSPPAKAATVDLLLDADWRTRQLHLAYMRLMTQLMMRLGRLHVPSDVHIDADDTVRVDLVPLAPERRERLRRMLAWPLRLDFRVLDDDSAPARDGAGRPVPFDDRVHEASSSWRAPDGRVVHERFWASTELPLLKLFVAALGRDGDGRSELLIGPYLAQSGVAYRTYLVEHGAHDLDSDDVGHTRVFVDDQGRTLVELFFTDGGGRRRLAQLTRQNVGRKLAIVLDHTVVTTLVVDAVIEAGTAKLLLASNVLAKEAREILALGALALPIEPIDQAR